MEEAAYGLNCKVRSFNLKYPGLQLMQIHEKNLHEWVPVVETIRSRLESWESRFLSFGDL